MDVKVTMGVAVGSGVGLGSCVNIWVTVGIIVTVGADAVRSAAKVEMADVWTAPISTVVEISVDAEGLQPTKRTVDMITIRLLRTNLKLLIFLGMDFSVLFTIS